MSILKEKRNGAPPFNRQRQIKPPGLEEGMNPRADHGEESYKGARLLDGRSAVITGADSGIGRAVAIAFAREGGERLHRLPQYVYVFLASARASYVTGEIYGATGGQTPL